MNERMTQLHVEAARYAKEKYPNDIVEWSICMSEKFAELIIRECGIALSPMLRDMVSRGQAFDLIKQHFGVEE